MSKMTQLRQQSWQKFLREEMKKRNLNQAGFARYLQVSDATMSKWLGGGVKVPSEETLKDIAPILGISYEDLKTIAGWNVYHPSQLHPAIAPKEWNTLTEEEKDFVRWFSQQSKDVRLFMMRLLKEARMEVLTSKDPQ